MLKTRLNNSAEIDSTGGKILLVDSTGIYSGSNTTGYGAPNYTREEVANFIVGEYKKVSGDTSVVIENYSPLTASDFNAVVQGDGLYNFYMITVKIYENLEDIPVGEYGSYLDEIYLNGDVVSPDVLIDTDYSSEVHEVLFTGGVSLKMNSLKSLLVELHMNNPQDCNRKKITRLQQQFNELKGLTAGGVYEYQRGNKINAQKIFEYLTNYRVDELYGQ